jgi:hypothetical protein
MDDLVDVTITNLTDNQILKASSGIFVNAADAT